MLTHDFIKYLLETEKSYSEIDYNLFETRIHYHLRKFIELKEKEKRIKSRVWTIIVNYTIGYPNQYFNTDKVIVKSLSHIPESFGIQFELYAEKKDDAYKWIENSFKNINKIQFI